MTITDITKSKRKVCFQTLYDRRLAKHGWTWTFHKDVTVSTEGTPFHILEPTVFKGHHPYDGPTRVVTIPHMIQDYPENRFGRIETVVPDLCLIFPSPRSYELRPEVAEYCDDAGIPFRVDIHPFLVRYTTPSGRSRWEDQWNLFYVMLGNVGDQVILKLVFPMLR